MFMQIDTNKKEKVKVMIEHNFRTQTIIKELHEEIIGLQQNDYSVKEICAILNIELEYEIKENTLYKLLDKVQVVTEDLTKEVDKKTKYDEEVSSFENVEIDKLDGFKVPIFEFDS